MPTIVDDARARLASPPHPYFTPQRFGKLGIPAKPSSIDALANAWRMALIEKNIKPIEANMRSPW